MKHFFRLQILLVMLFLAISNVSAQVKYKMPPQIVKSPDDSLLREFENIIYYLYYGNFRKNITTYTMLKVDINGNGKITGINFSDSADTAFVNAWTNKKSPYDEKATMEKYAKIKGYKGLSLLIPVSYEPDYPIRQKAFTYSEVDALMKFNKQNFTGKSVMLDPIKIAILAKGDM